MNQFLLFKLVDFTFYQAIELLLIPNISKNGITDIAALERQAKNERHHDRVANLKNVSVTKE